MSKAKKTKTLKYLVVHNTNLEAFTSQITQLLNNGYVLAGGISITTSVREQSQVIYAQSLILEE